MMPRVLALRSATLCHRHGNCVRFLPELARVRSRSCHAQASSDVCGFVGGTCYARDGVIEFLQYYMEVCSSCWDFAVCIFSL